MLFRSRQALQVAQAAMPRLAVAEGSLDDLQAWRQQADELLKTAARARDDSLVADLAAMLQAAQAQSRLSGDASALQTALQAARARIS